MKNKINSIIAIAGVTVITLVILTQATSIKGITSINVPAMGTSENEILFSRATNTTTKTGNRAVTASTTSSGNTYYLVNDSSVSWNMDEYPGTNYIGNLAKNDIVYFTDSSSGTSDFCFQHVNSITITLNTTYSKEICIQTSLDSKTWTDNSFYCSSSNKTYSFTTPAHYIRLKWILDMSQYLKSLSLSYECTPGYVEEVSSIRVDNPKTKYGIGDAFVEPDVYATYTSGVEAKVEGATFTGFDSSLEVASQTITVSYSGVTTTYQISISTAADDLVGTFAHSYFTLVFNQNNTGKQIYGTEILNFSWTHIGANITLTYVSGELGNFGSYRLFSSTSTPNTTPSLSGNTLSVKTYNTFGSATSRTLTRQ